MISWKSSFKDFLLFSLILWHAFQNVYGSPKVESYQTGLVKNNVVSGGTASIPSSRNNLLKTGEVVHSNSASAAVSGTSQIASGTGASASVPTASTSASSSSMASSIEGSGATTVASGSNTVVNCEGPPTTCDLAGRNDFNPALSGGQPGQPGIKARLNPAAFRYISTELVGVLNYRIRRTTVPDISQCLPQVQGCIRVRNILVNNYRCTRDVSLHPAPPNRLVMDVNNVDVSATGNLGGQVTIMVPLALYGQIHLNLQRVHVRVGVVVVSNGTYPALRLASCSASAGRVQVDIINGGLLGDIARQQLQAKLNRIVKQQISRQLCNYIPQILDQQLNSKIPSLVPTKFSLNDLIGMAMNSPCFSQLTGVGGGEEESTGEETTAATVFKKKRRAIVASNHNRAQNPLKRRQSNGDAKEADQWITADPETSSAAAISTGGETTTVGLDLGDTGTDSTDTGGDGSSSSGGGTDLLPILTSLIDLTKFQDIYLNLQMMNTEASANDFTVGIRGGFSQCGWGCTPFAAFPMQVPQCANDCRMADALISDFTLNSLLYHLHRVGFFVFTITPDTPDIGKLMVLNCDDAASESGAFFLEDHGVELDEVETMSQNSTKARKLRKSKVKKQRRFRRQEEEGSCGGGMDVNSLIELGFCIGNLLPAAKEKNEEAGAHEKVDIKIQTERAPAVFIHENGTIDVDFITKMEFFKHSDQALITTFRAVGKAQFNVAVNDSNRVSATMEISSLKVQDIGGKSGLDSETLDTFVSLISEKLAAVLNCILEKGCKIEVPEGFGGLPINLSDLKIGFVEHGLHLQANFKLQEGSELLNESEPCPARKRKHLVKAQ